MKSYISLFILLLLSAAGVSQPVTFPDPKEIATKKFVDSLVTARLAGTIPIPTTPCKEGPTVLTVSSVTQTGLTFTFHGVNVFELSWELKAREARAGEVKPTSNHVAIKYSTLPPGSYTLTLKGISCTGTSSIQVLIPNSGTVPPDPVNKTGLKAFTVAPKQYIALSVVDSEYSDNTPGDYTENGQTFRNENGRKYLAFYWINEHPYRMPDDTPKPFKKVKLPPGQVISIRKVYVDSRWQNTYLGYKVNSYETWYQNPEADTERIFKNAVAAITTVNVDAAPGTIKLKLNPFWMNASKLVPQYFFNPADAPQTKPVAIQSYPTYTGEPERTYATLKASGVTHVWDMSMHTMGFFNDSWKPTGLNPSGITRALMLGTQGLGSMFPGLAPYKGQLNQQQAEQWADVQQLFDNAIITDEFAEGTYPQFDQSREWFYARMFKRIKDGGYKNVQLVGEYGYGSQKLGLPKPPLSTYARNMWTPAFPGNLETVAGSSDTKFKNYALHAGKYRGNCVGGYYAISEDVTSWVLEFPYNSIQYNATPDKPRLLFTWAGMQSNVNMADTPQKDSGTMHPDGSVSYHFPDTPPEIMKVMGFFGLLFFDSVYLWDAYGLPSALDENQWISCGISQDAWILGTRWFAELEPFIREADDELLVADFSVDSKDVKFSTAERRIPRMGRPMFNNTYFNEVREKQSGIAIVIPSSTPKIIYINPHLPTTESERVVVKFEGKSYDLGVIPGTTLAVTE